MKKLLKFLGLSLCLLLVLVLVAVYLLLSRGVKLAVETVGPGMTRTHVRLDAASFSPFSGSGSLNGLLVGNPDGFKSEKALSVGEIKTALQLSTVFSDPLVIESIHIDAPEVVYEIARGGSNIDRLLKSINEFCGKDTSARKLIIREFRIANGKVHLSPAMALGRPLVVSLPDLHLTNIGAASDGETLQQVIAQIIGPLTKSLAEAGLNIDAALKDVTEKTSQILKDAGTPTGQILKDVSAPTGQVLKDASGKAGKALEGVRGLLGK